MSEAAKPGVGSISWVDLTVAQAPALRDFYAAVTGWQPSEAAMGDYSDYCMKDPGGRSVAGVCHARRENSGLPAEWLIYIVVADLEKSPAECRALGGAVIAGPKSMGQGARFAVIRDPAGAVAALYHAPG